MDKLEQFFNEVADFINYCVQQDFIPEDEEDYIIAEIEKIKERIINGEE